MFDIFLLQSDDRNWIYFAPRRSNQSKWRLLTEVSLCPPWLAALHGRQRSVRSGRLQSGPSWSQAVPRHDAGRVLLQAPPAAAAAVLRPDARRCRQEHLQQAGLGRHAPVCSRTSTGAVMKLFCFGVNNVFLNVDLKYSRQQGWVINRFD